MNTNFKKIKNSDVLIGYLAQSLNITAGLLLIPFIVICLTSSDTGIWFVFLTLGGMATLIEMGLQPTLLRNASYIYSGADNLKENGLPSNFNNEGKVNLLLLASLFYSAKKIYFYIGLASVFILFLLGGLYLSTIVESRGDVFIAWLFFASGSAINIYYGYVNSFIQGRGDVSLFNINIIFSKLAYLFFALLFLFLGFGLIGLSSAFLISAVLGRILSLFFLKKDSRIVEALNIKEVRINLLSTIWPNVKKLGLVFLGAFLIQRFSILLATSFLGLDAAASYGMTMTLMIALMSVASIIFQINAPLLSSLQGVDDKEQIRRVMGEVYVLSWSLYIVGFIFIFFLGEYLLEFIGSNTKLLDRNYLILIAFMIFLEMNHSISASYLATTNRIDFLSASLISGFAVAVIGYYSIQFYGLLGLIVSQAMVQIIYNNWKWPVMALNNMDSDFNQIIKHGFDNILKRLKLFKL